MWVQSESEASQEIKTPGFIMQITNNLIIKYGS
jgi:hypothetical protein